ncbi:UNVERIFIED_CONTAM: hypothetical protein PYX00_011772 [Menopon gallinae]|uniref:Phosphotransferase n=1 Tax=Menopon gallinae TaxID=328185 RepID=A0AAW2H8M0_9NEOP
MRCADEDNIISGKELLTKDGCSEHKGMDACEKHRNSGEKKAYEAFYLDDKRMFQIANSFGSSLQMALDGVKAQNNMFIDTHVRIPRGITQQGADEEKTVFVVDVGGTYLKTCLIRMHMSGEYSFAKDVEQYAIPKMGAKDTSIWKWIADIIKEYLGECRLNEYVGAMTFSYAMAHESIGSGTVISCGKNFPFSKSDVVGCNPITAINNACKSAGLRVTFRTLLNDTTATALASLIKAEDTILGIVLGTGTNGAVVVPDSEHDGLKIIDTEWGSYEHEAISTTEFDREIMDEMRAQGINFNNLDVMIGGYKFVELVRRTCLAMGIRDYGDIQLEDLQGLLKRSISAGHELSAQERVVVRCMKAIKTRTSSILASLVLGIVKTLKRNGMCTKKVTRLLALEGISRDMVEWDFIAEASLVGSAYSIFLAR